MGYLTLMMGAVLAIGSLAPEHSDVDPSEWNAFKVAHNKEYKNEGIEAMRKLVYAHNKQRVAEHNITGGQSFELGLNHLADMSPFEVSQVMNGFRGSELKGKMRAGEHKTQLLRVLDNSSLPEEVDWRKVPGRVSSVKDQGQCGSCWAFAAIGGLEGQEAKTANILNFGDADLVDLSVQNLMDCDEEDHGCDGGLMDSAYEFIKSEGGVDDWKSYPYEAVQNKCRFQKNKVVMGDEGSMVLPAGDEDALKRQVATFGPVPVAIDASQASFQLYKRGVYKPARCGSDISELDHGVLVVGYGTDPKHGDFWIVKNSWGPKWGEKGYIRMARNKNNKCGIATFAVIPSVKQAPKRAFSQLNQSRRVKAGF